MEHQLHNLDCLDFLTQFKGKVPLLFADPPDNLGLKYDEYVDKRPADDYYNFIDIMIRKALCIADCVWISYYWEHDLEISYRLQSFLRRERSSVRAKKCIWRYTFGQYTDGDFASGFRYLLRLSKPQAKFRPDAIKVPSRRMELGDSRASGPRVPDDVWEIPPDIFDFPRVVGNSDERRSWHPTQHPEAVLRRIILMHSDKGDSVIDLFGGTGTTLRVCEQVGRTALISEISKDYCHRIVNDSATYLSADSSVTLW
jgi:DNA modification methylase